MADGRRRNPDGSTSKLVNGKWVQNQPASPAPTAARPDRALMTGIDSLVGTLQNSRPQKGVVRMPEISREQFEQMFSPENQAQRRQQYGAALDRAPSPQWPASAPPPVLEAPSPQSFAPPLARNGIRPGGPFGATMQPSNFLQALMKKQRGY
jgi:hypothetical protein